MSYYPEFCSVDVCFVLSYDKCKTNRKQWLAFSLQRAVNEVIVWAHWLGQRWLHQPKWSFPVGSALRRTFSCRTRMRQATQSKCVELYILYDYVWLLYDISRWVMTNIYENAVVASTWSKVQGFQPSFWVPSYVYDGFAQLSMLSYMPLQDSQHTYILVPIQKSHKVKPSPTPKKMLFIRTQIWMNFLFRADSWASDMAGLRFHVSRSTHDSSLLLTWWIPHPGWLAGLIFGWLVWIWWSSLGGLDPITLETAWGLSDVERDGMLTLGMGFRLKEGIWFCTSGVESYAYTLTCYML